MKSLFTCVGTGHKQNVEERDILDTFAKCVHSSKGILERRPRNEIKIYFEYDFQLTAIEKRVKKSESYAGSRANSKGERWKDGSI